MKRGRPTQSVIRQNVVEILYYLRKGYGYQIAKIYNEVFEIFDEGDVYVEIVKYISVKYKDELDREAIQFRKNNLCVNEY